MLCVAKLTKASMKDGTKSRKLGSQSKMGSCIKLDDIDTETGMCAPIHVVVLVSLKLSSSTQVDSKSKSAMLFEEFLVDHIKDTNESSLSISVSRS